MSIPDFKNTMKVSALTYHNYVNIFSLRLYLGVHTCHHVHGGRDSPDPRQ